MSISMLELLKSKTNSLQQTVEIRRIGKANQIDEAVSNVMADLSKNVSLPASTNFQSNTEILKVFTETMEKSFQHKELVDKLLKEMVCYFVFHLFRSEHNQNLNISSRLQDNRIC